MTGTLAHFASSSTSAWEKVRIMIPSTIRDSTRAVSLIGSPRPIWMSRLERNRAWPPSWKAPTSKETRVRVDDLAKTMASVLPARGFSR